MLVAVLPALLRTFLRPSPPSLVGGVWPVAGSLPRPLRCSYCLCAGRGAAVRWAGTAVTPLFPRPGRRHPPVIPPTGSRGRRSRRASTCSEAWPHITQDYTTQGTAATPPVLIILSCISSYILCCKTNNRMMFRLVLPRDRKAWVPWSPGLLQHWSNLLPLYKH